MKRAFLSALIAAPLFSVAALAQQPGQPQFKIDSTNRTLSVSASETVSVEPEVAILHIGFSTQPNDAKAAYAEGARTSNAIIDAVKQAGVPENDIRSERQYLDRDWSSKQHKYKLTQQWTVRVSPERAAEVLDAAINAGATSSGEIEWTVKDEKGLEKDALNKAAERSRENAAVLAKGMNVRLGNLIYVTNELSGGGGIHPRVMAFSADGLDQKAAAPPLAIEPHKVTRTATVYAVFAIE